MQDIGQKKLCIPLIYWCETDIQAIITWFGKCNEKDVIVNYKVWTTSNHTKKAG